VDLTVPPLDLRGLRLPTTVFDVGLALSAVFDFGLAIIVKSYFTFFARSAPALPTPFLGVFVEDFALIFVLVFTFAFAMMKRIKN
jgi:hypothetical protein